MRTKTTVAIRLLAVVALVGMLQCVKAQARSPVANFQGEWEWAIYAKSKTELPPAYRGEKLKDVPAAAIDLQLKQRGNKLTGEYSGSDRFLARLENGELDATIRDNTARVDLTSGFGGRVTVLLTLRRNTLHWKTLKSEGEAYFPMDAYLHRLPKAKRQR